MSNTFLPTGFTVTASFATLASYLATTAYGGDITNNSVTTQNGYIRNRDVTIDLYVGFGATAPAKYEIVGPQAALTFNAGMNVNEIWIRSASSTVAVGFSEGSALYIPPTVNGVIGTITATENTVPKADVDGNLVASSISDSGGTVTIANGADITGTLDVGDVTTFAADVGCDTKLTVTGLTTFDGGIAASGAVANDFSGGTGTFLTSTGANSFAGAVTVTATTPSITTAAGKSNTGFVSILGKTSGGIKFTTADATGSLVTVTNSAQSVGAAALSIPDFAGVADEFTFKTKSQTMANKTFTAPVLGAASATSVANGAGLVGTPSYTFTGQTDLGLYKASATQLGVSVGGALVAVADTLGLAADSVRNRVNLGTTPVGTVAIVEYGDGRDITTVLTLTNFIVGALAGAGAPLGIGNIVYVYPAGQHLELVYSFSSLVLTAAGTAVATDTGLGSVIASGAVSVLSGTGTFEDRLTGQTISTGAGGGAAVSAMAGATAGFGAGIAINVTGSIKNLFLNSAGTWNANNTGNLTASGTICLKWTQMS